MDAQKRERKTVSKVTPKVYFFFSYCKYEMDKNIFFLCEMLTVSLKSMPWVQGKSRPTVSQNRTPVDKPRLRRSSGINNFPNVQLFRSTLPQAGKSRTFLADVSDLQFGFMVSNSKDFCRMVDGEKLQLSSWRRRSSPLAWASSSPCTNPGCFYSVKRMTSIALFFVKLLLNKYLFVDRWLCPHTLHCTCAGQVFKGGI